MFLYKNYFEFTFSNESETDLLIVSVKDRRTNYIVKTAISDKNRQTPSIMAFAGARYSRSEKSIDDIFREIKVSGKNAQEKLAAIFRNYGHASVADMAQLFAYIENIPLHYATKFFYETSLGGGQERSTRYQNFGNTETENLIDFLPWEKRENIDFLNDYNELNSQFKELQSTSIEKYSKWVDILSQKYTDYFQIDTSKKSQKNALAARVFDSARYFLINGINIRTSLAWVTSAREWARIISILKNTDDCNLGYLAEQLEILFAPDPEFANSIEYLPEAPDLIRYTGADEITGQNLQKLDLLLQEMNFSLIAEFCDNSGFNEIDANLFGEEFSGSTKVTAQNILSLYPTVKPDWLMNWLQNLSDKQKRKFSQVLLNGFNHHKQMGNQFRVNVKSFQLICSIAETRDLNRHRAWGRFIPILSLQKNYFEILKHGYTLPLYLTENSDFFDIRTDFENDLKAYYTQLETFLQKTEKTDWFPKNLIFQLLPFGHVMQLWLHGSVKEISYLTKLRIRPGGHINYRVIAYLMGKKVAESDPFLSELLTENFVRPDSTSHKEFLDRS